VESDVIAVALDCDPTATFAHDFDWFDLLSMLLVFVLMSSPSSERI